HRRIGAAAGARARRRAAAILRAHRVWPPRGRGRGAAPRGPGGSRPRAQAAAGCRPDMTGLRRAETAFRWMMRAYPARFRRTHGLALFELFRDEARETKQQHGSIGLIWLVARTAVDTIVSVPSAWLRGEPTHLRTSRYGGQARLWE